MEYVKQIWNNWMVYIMTENCEECNNSCNNGNTDYDYDDNDNRLEDTRYFTCCMCDGMGYRYACDLCKPTYKEHDDVLYDVKNMEQESHAYNPHAYMEFGVLGKNIANFDSYRFWRNYETIPHNMSYVYD